MRSKSVLGALLVALLLTSSARAQLVPMSQIAMNYSSHHSLSMDPTTGMYYTRTAFSSGPGMLEYANRAQFEAGVSSRTINLQNGGFFSTYFGVANGKVFGRTSNSGTDSARWDVATTTQEATRASFPGMCGANGSCTFNWGGYSGVNFMFDGSSIFVFGRNTPGAGWQLNRLDADLNIQNTYQHPDSSLGFSFMINGFLITGSNFNSNLINTMIDTASGMVSTINFTLDGPPSPYWGCAFYDPNDDVVYIHTASGSQTYRIDNAASTFNVPGGRILLDTIDTAAMMVAPGQQGIAVTMTAENTGMNAVDVTSVDLSFTDAGGMDVTSEYVVTPDPGNPTSVAVGMIETFTFSVDVSPMAGLGDVTINGQLDGIEQSTGRMISRTGAMNTDSWEVVSALAEVRVVDAVDLTVSQGGTGYPVTVSVENPGLGLVDVFGILISFTGTADRTGEYVVTPDPMNAMQIAPGATETFQFAVDVSGMATIETITLDADFTGRDAITLAIIIDQGADVTDSWDLVACGATLCGDCTGDGQVTILDALQGAQHSAGLIALTGTDFTNCNVVGDVEPNPGAAVTILDALTIAQFSAGLPVTLVCC